MLKPLNILVFGSADIYELIAATSTEEHADEIIEAIAEGCSEDSIVRLYLPSKKEQQFYDSYKNELANLIVENSELHYGDAAYIIF